MVTFLNIFPSLILCAMLFWGGRKMYITFRNMIIAKQLNFLINNQLEIAELLDKIKMTIDGENKRIIFEVGDRYQNVSVPQATRMLKELKHKKITWCDFVLSIPFKQELIEWDKW
jgi:hypothetical protein